MASKNLAKYLCDEKIGKQYLEDFCSMKGCSVKNAILNKHVLTAMHTKGAHPCTSSSGQGGGKRVLEDFF